jgi:hypothetical protein
MSWADSVVRVARGGNQGTGVFVGPDLVLTAGHVVQPAGSSTPAPGELVVSLPRRDNAVTPVAQVAVHAEWRQAGRLTADMALLRVGAVAGVGLPQWRDFHATDVPIEVALYGYPLLPGLKRFDTGFLDTREDPSNPGYWIFESATFDVHDGMSGGPFVYQDRSGTIYVVGVATHDAHDPSAHAFNGVPLRANTYFTLLDQI